MSNPKEASQEDAGDGLHIPTIKLHSLEKIQRHNHFASMFARGMKNRWKQRAYLGLYCGAGLARVEETGKVVETAALSALRAPFTHYIFVDSDPACIQALEQRARPLVANRTAKFITGDVNASVNEIRQNMPRFSGNNGLLSFCFVDPFDAGLHFKTIRMLAQFKMDFMILLALGQDVRRNFWSTYYGDRRNEKIANLLEDPEWRREFESADKRQPVHFVLRKFDEGMTALGYKPPKPGHHLAVNISGKGVFLYYLVVYSKNALGQRFWEQTLSGTTSQTTMDFDS